MKLQDAIAALQRIEKLEGWRADGMQLVVPIFLPGTMGGTPAEIVTGIQAGFDWDAKKVFIRTEATLSKLSEEDKAAILESVRKDQSWHSYEREKRHREEVKALKDRIAELEGGETV